MILRLLLILFVSVFLSMTLDNVYGQYHDCAPGTRLITESREYIMTPRSICSDNVPESMGLEISEKGEIIAEIDLNQKITQLTGVKMKLFDDNLYVAWSEGSCESPGISFKVISADGKMYEDTIKTPATNFDYISVVDIIQNKDGATIIWEADTRSRLLEHPCRNVGSEDHTYLGYSKMEANSLLSFEVIEDARYLNTGEMGIYGDFLMYRAAFNCPTVSEDDGKSCKVTEYNNEKITHWKKFLLLADPQSDDGFQKSDLPPPERQSEILYDSKNVICQDGYTWFYKMDRTKVCVFPESTYKLTERGWGNQWN